MENHSTSAFVVKFSIKLNLTNSPSMACPGDRTLLRKGDEERTLDVEKRVSWSVYHRICKSTWTVFIEHSCCHLLFILIVLHLVIVFQEWNSPYFAISLERQNSPLHMLSFNTPTDFTKTCCGSKMLRLHNFCPLVLVVCRHNKNLIWSAAGKYICLCLWYAPKKQKRD